MDDDERERLDSAYREIVDGANAKIRGETTTLMDLQHDGIQKSRAVVQVLREFQDEINAVIERLVDAHRHAAVSLAGLYAGVIAFEQGLVLEEDDEEGGEEEEDDDEVPAD